MIIAALFALLAIASLGGFAIIAVVERDPGFVVFGATGFLIFGVIAWSVRTVIEDDRQRTEFLEERYDIKITHIGPNATDLDFVNQDGYFCTGAFANPKDDEWYLIDELTECYTGRGE